MHKLQFIVLFPTSLRTSDSGAPRSGSKMAMIAGGNHTSIYEDSVPYEVSKRRAKLKFEVLINTADMDGACNRAGFFV